jgi:putative copper resistance protein D
VDDALVWVRGVHFAATFTVAGVAFFIAFIGDPAFRKADAGARLPGIVRRRLAFIAWIGLALTVVSGAAWFILVAASMSDQPLANVFSEVVLGTVASDTDFGRAWLVRLALACLLAGFLVSCLCAKTEHAERGRPGWITLAIVVLAACLVGTIAWAGHAVGGPGLGGTIHLAADVLHLVAVAAWVGTLLPLALLLAAACRDSGPTATAVTVAATATTRFSTLGVLSVATILCTGSINTWYLAGSIPALTETDYGRLLLLKIALFLGMVAIAAVNRLRLIPRLFGNGAAHATREALRQLRRNVLVEIAAGAGVLAIVAVLGMSPPGIDEQAMPHAHHETH